MSEDNTANIASKQSKETGSVKMVSYAKRVSVVKYPAEEVNRGNDYRTLLEKSKRKRLIRDEKGRIINTIEI